MFNPVTSRVCETHDIIWCGCMYLTSKNYDPIANVVSNEDPTVTEVIKVTLPNDVGREGTAKVA
jgi:hypothetical protein